MIRDDRLRFAQNERPFVHPIQLGAGPTYVPLPNSFPILGGANRTYDMGTPMDLGSGEQMVARFRVTETVAGGLAGVVTGSPHIGFAIAADSQEDLQSAPRILQQSEPFVVAALTEGFTCEIPLPKLNSLVRLSGLGLRFLSLGLVVDTGADFSGGAFDAHLVLNNNTDMEQFGSLPKHASGFTV